MPVLAWLLLGVAMAAALPARGQDEDASTPSAVFVGPSTSSAGASQAPSGLRGSGSRGARRIVLPPPAVDERRSSVPRSTDGGPVLPRIGFGRDLALLTGSAPSVDDLAWEDLAAGGRAASLAIVSPGARALRLQLEISKAPPGLEVRFYDPEEAAARIEPVPRSELIRNGGGAPATYWSPTVAGDGIAMELYLPAGTTANLEMVVRRISHLEENPRSLEDVGDAPCSADLDIACRVGAVSATTRSSVAKYTFTNVHGFASYCTGTLLNDLDATTQVPYFLTAEHCVGNQSEAASMELYWFFERAECGGRAPRTVTVQQGGAVMLSSESLSGGADYSFLRLNRDPPAGAGMSGWTSVPLSLEDAVVGVHHPSGDLKLVLEGVVEYNDRPDKVQILGTAGVSVGGSSGSGIWKRIGRKDYLVGVLSGGTKQCHETQHDLYGRMEHLYAQVSEWLGDGASVGGRPASSVTGLALVDASNGSTLMELREDGAVFDLDATDVRSFNIRAGLSAGVAPTAVAMELSGAQAAARTSRGAPHTLYGEHGGSGLSPGAYTVSAVPTDASGEVLPSRSARFTVTGEAEASDIAVTELALTTPVGGPDLAVLSDRAAIDVRHGQGELLGLRAATGGTGRVGSVGFEVMGAAVLSLTADTAPFTVDVELPAGTYSIAATPYPEAGLQGMAGPPTTVAGVMLSYPASPVAGFTLVDAEGGPPDPDLQVIEDGSVLDLSAVPGVVNIRADVIADAPEIGSVRVELAGQKSARRLENRPAYALFGDEPEGDYRGELLPDGHYTVTATAYEGKEGGGDAYPGLAVRFTVTGAPLSDDAMLADDATLSALSLSDVDIGTFSSGTTSYSATAAHAVSATTVTATPSDDGATVTISDGSGSVERSTRTVALSEGANTIAVTVTAEDGVTERVYTVSVTRQAAPPDDVPAGFPVDAYPSGLWSDGEVVWVSDLNGSRLLAYDRVDGGRARGRDIATPEVGAPAGLWSDGGTLWVADYEDGAVLAYRLSDGARLAERDVGLAAANAAPTGLWSDRETLWVADYAQRRIYAYGLDGGVRREARELDVDDGELRPWGLWSKGDVLWVAHWLGGELRAYRLSDGERLDGNDLDLESAGNAHPMGVYAEGGHVWTTDTTERKVYVHAFGDDDGGVGSPSSDALLSGLALSGVDIGTFSSAMTSYSATVAHAVSTTTVTATPSEGSATVTISDGAGGVEGSTRTVALSEGANTITVSVTAGDGVTERVYTVTVTREAAPSDDATLSALSLSDVDIGTFSSGTTSYSATVAHAVSVTTVTATPSDGSATVTISDGAGSAERSTRTVALSEGANTITVTVTAGDGVTERVYTVTVTREAAPSDDARLSALSLSDVDIGTFSPATMSYSAPAAPAVTATTVTATPSDGSATVTISDGAGGVEGPTRTVALSEGANTITVTVTAADGTTTETYTVTVARAAPPVVSIAAVASPVSEGELAEFRVSRTGPTTGELTVDVSVGFGNDSTADEYAIKLRAGKRSRVGITRLDDNNVVRDDVTVTWTLEESDRYMVSADANSAFVVLEENDAAEFALSVDPDAIAEGESATVEVAIANGVTFAAEQTIELDFGGSTATAAADYSVSPDSLALAAGARTARATVAAMRDSDTEGDETVSVAASHDGADIGTVSLKIEDAAYIPLTGWFEDVPESHDGSTAFTVTLRFSAPLSSGSAAKLRGGAVAVGDGTLSSARRVNGDRAVWTLKVTPSGTADVTLTLSAEVACDAGGVCTADGRRLSVQVGTTVPGPTALSPVLTGASVSGARLTLSYDDELDGGSTPSPPDFVVLSGSDAVPVRSVQVAGATATLTLARPVPAGERVAASYLVAPMHPLRDAQGRAAAPFTATAVRNATPAGWVFAAAPAPVPATPAAGIPEAALSGSPSRLDLTSRQLSDIPVLAGLPLTELNLHGNALADLAPLSTQPGLRVLDLSGNRITELWPLAGLTALERLDLSGNRIVDVSPLAELARLEVLLLDGNAVAEVLPLSPLTGLVHLGLSGNRIEDVGLLSELGALRRLDLSGNPVADVSPLGDLSRLVWLNLVGNPVDDLAPLGRLTRLRWLWLDAGAAGSGALAPLTEGLAPLRIEAVTETAAPP